MRRRALIVGMGAATALPAVAQARPPAKPNIGILVLGDPDPQPFVKTFREGLHELGYVEGQNIVLDIRSAKGDSNRLSYLAETLVRSNVDILVAYQTPAATAAQKATRSIPIVMAYVGDPVATGLVSSLSRPGGNITGSSTVADELAGKNLELLRQFLPSAHRVGVLANAVDTFTEPFLEQVRQAAGHLSFEVQLYLIHPGDNSPIEPAQTGHRRADAQVSPSDDLADLGVFPRRRPDVVRCKPGRKPASIRVLRRQDPEGQQTWRFADPATNQVRAGHQPQDRQGARIDCPAAVARPLRRGDRMKLRNFRFGSFPEVAAQRSHVRYSALPIRTRPFSP